MGEVSKMASDIRYRALCSCTQHLIDGIAAHTPAEIGGSLLGLSLIEPDDYSKLLLTNTPQKHAAVIVEAVSNKVKSEPDQYYDEFMKYLNTNHNLRYLQKAIEEKLSKLMSFY